MRSALLLSYPESKRARDLLSPEDLMPPSPEVRIGERLRFYRQAKGKTQAVVAGLAGVTEDYLSQIERGLKTPTILLLLIDGDTKSRAGIRTVSFPAEIAPELA